MGLLYAVIGHQNFAAAVKLVVEPMDEYFLVLDMVTWKYKTPYLNPDLFCVTVQMYSFTLSLVLSSKELSSQ